MIHGVWVRCTMHCVLIRCVKESSKGLSRQQRNQWNVPSTTNDKYTHNVYSAYGIVVRAIEFFFMCERAHERQAEERREKKTDLRNNGYWKQKTRQEGMWSGDYAEMISESVDLHTWM